MAEVVDMRSILMPNCCVRTLRLKGLDGPHLYGEFNLLQQIAYHPDEASVYLAGILDRFADAICEQLEEPEDSTRDAVSLSYEFSLIELQNAIAVMFAFVKTYDLPSRDDRPSSPWHEPPLGTLKRSPRINRTQMVHFSPTWAAWYPSR